MARRPVRRGTRWCEPTHYDNISIHHPKGYDENKRERIALAVRLHFLNQKGDELKQKTSVTCSCCGLRSKIKDLTMTTMFIHYPPYNSYDEGEDQTIYYMIDCTKCNGLNYIPKDDPLVQLRDQFKTTDRKRIT